MGKILIVLGPTGSGKSRSVKNLDPTKTIVVNVLKKSLPFRGSESMYSMDKGNLMSISNWETLVPFIKNVDALAPHVTTLVIDDSRFIMEKEFMRRAKEVGYTKFTELAQHFQAIIEAAEESREDLKVVLMMHDDDVINDKVIVAKKVKLVGKMVEDHYNPLEVVPICLYCKPTFDKNNKPVYQFFTQKALLDGVELPAKSPEEMFATETIPNDLSLVMAAIDAYYTIPE